VVSATHDLTLAAAYADRLALISCGALVAVGAPRDVLTTTILGEHYGVSLRVLHDADGGVAVIPVRPTPLDHSHSEL
jgi:iron complex transport system ATP-binding protein